MWVGGCYFRPKCSRNPHPYTFKLFLSASTPNQFRGGVTTQIPDICSLVWVGTHKNSYFHRMNKLICASRRRQTTTGSVVKRNREIFKNGVIFQKSAKINKSTKIPFFLTRRGCHNGEYSGRGRIIKHFPKNLDTWKK